MSLLPSDPISGFLESSKAIILATVLAVLLGVIGYLGYTKSLLETKVAEDRSEIIQYQNDVEQWKLQTAHANEALIAFKIAQKSREVKAATAIATAQKSAQNNNDLAKGIMSTKQDGDECTATKKLFDNFFRGKK